MTTLGANKTQVSRRPYRAERDPPAAEMLELFRQTRTKIAIQKDGALTDIARAIFLDSFGICIPPASKSRLSVGLSEDGKTGIVFARNKNICDLVSEGAVQMAIIGTDRLIEDRAEDKVDVVAAYRERAAWSLVLATSSQSTAQRPEDITRVATQYPVIAGHYFEQLGMPDVDIITTAGGTELYPYLDYGEAPIDAIIDLSATGESLLAHDLVAWTPAIGDVYPVLIQARRL
jgi:ATP phosphoribosyltransferase